ncbi:MAG TPA: tetratricopeptide repeat protein, partial [Steroidobacteraceae bacterium]|nr:tetratricopeptide repeat protein [Steroidobacteraceae bacterium]
CFPPALRFEVRDGVVTDIAADEPLAADVRPGKDHRGTARLKIVAGLLGIPLGRLRQRELARRQKRLTLITASSLLGCLGFGAISVVAVRARNEAERQRAEAVRQSLTARRTADFMKSLFEVADPGESRGNSITAREVLDRGVAQIGTQLQDTPVVRADLTTTLGEVYASLGLYNESLKLLDTARQVPGLPPDLAARTKVATSESLFQRGDYPEALRALAEVMPALDLASAEHGLRLRALATYGDAYFLQDDFVRAREYYARTLALANGPENSDAILRSRALQGIAQADMSVGRFDEARIGFQRALTQQVAATGERHPRVAEIYSEIGAMEYLHGNPAAAIENYRQCLAIDKQVFGEGHPATAFTLNNLARVLLEQRDFPAARSLLQQAVALAGNNVSDSSDTMIFATFNLGLSVMATGDLKAAEPMLAKSLSGATNADHRLRGPILTALANLYCSSGRYELGLSRLELARPILAERYPDDAWRLAYAENVQAGCLTGMKRYARAKALMQSSLPLVLKKWPAATIFGHESLERAVRLYTLAGDDARAAAYHSQLSAR